MSFTPGGCTGIATTTINLNYVTADPIQLSNGTISHNICAGTNPNLDLQSVGVNKHLMELMILTMERIIQMELL